MSAADLFAQPEFREQYTQAREGEDNARLDFRSNTPAPPREARILGVDLGAEGAIALLDGGGYLLHVLDMPCLPDGPRARPTIAAPLLATAIRDLNPDRAYIEFVSSRPTDSPMSAFAFGMARASITATLAVLGVPHEFITAPAWKRLIGIGAGRGQKSTARAEAVRRWPVHAERFARVCDDGRAEAALIAVAGMMRERAGK